jgi:hypothetical protein
MAAFTLGVVNGEKRVRSQWMAAEQATVDNAKKARRRIQAAIWSRHQSRNAASVA